MKELKNDITMESEQKIKKSEKSLSQQFLEQLESYDKKIAKKFSIHSNCDGKYNGVLFEFKKEEGQNSKRDALIECIKNASKLRLEAKDVPSKFAITFLTEKKAYIYDAIDFFDEIHEVYNKSASKTEKEMEVGIRIKEKAVIDYNDSYKPMIDFMQEKSSTARLKVKIDRNNVVAMAQRFYREKAAQKQDFYNELIKPDKLIYILQYAKDEDELSTKCLQDFPDLIDVINDVPLKKETGAFYTPEAYCKLSTKMVREAIAKIKEANPNNDYIILDRCAGTGNLEQFLTDEELSHTICSTFEMWEWKILNERYKSTTPNQFGQYTKLRLIIPPEVFVEKQRHSNILQTIIAGDALSEHFITGSVTAIDLLPLFKDDEQKKILSKEYEHAINILNGYAASQNCNVIVLENPPYRNETLNSNSSKATKGKGSFVKSQMNDVKGATKNDILNQFIWSAQKYYLKKPNDYMILYSPVKYFKSHNVCNKKFIDGYLVNRKHFHASASAVSLMWWQNIDEKKESFTLKAYDIELQKENGLSIQEQTNQGTLKYEKDVEVKKVYKTFIEYHDKRKFEDDIKVEVCCNGGGYCIKAINKQNALWNKNMAGYLSATDFAVNHLKLNLLSRNIENKKVGFYLRSDNFVEKLPLFCAKLYPQEKWYEKDVYFTTADGGFEYVKDEEFLKSCLIYTCLSQKNNCRSFLGSDNKWYYNELCLLQDTLADTELAKFTLNDIDNALINKWQSVLNEAQTLKSFTKYGLYQIQQELLEKKKSGKSKIITQAIESYDATHYLAETEQEVMLQGSINIINSGNLSSYITELTQSLKTYYAQYIEPKLFKYQLLK